MEVVKNKNRGYFAQCPNKANHSGVPAAAEKKLAETTPKPPQQKSEKPALKPARTLLGW